MGMGKTGIPWDSHGNGNASDKLWDGSGMGMGMKSLKWEGFGTKILFPHISSATRLLVLVRATIFKKI